MVAGALGMKALENPKVISTLSSALKRSGQSINSPGGRKVIDGTLKMIRRALEITARGKTEKVEQDELTSIIETAQPGLRLGDQNNTSEQPAGFMLR